MALVSIRVPSSDASNVLLTLPSQNGSLIYNGSEQSPAWLNYDPAQILIGGDTEATNAGTYTAIFTPQGNCAWTDGTSNPKQVTWTITKAVPSLSATISEAVPYGETGVIGVSGNTGGGVITATSDDDSVVSVQSATTNSVTVECVSLSENDTIITITVAETANYLSGTTTCAVSTTKADGSITLSADSGTVAYGTPRTFTVTNNLSGGELSITSSNSAYVNASINGNTVTVTVVELGDSTQTITVTSAATANYNAASATYIVTSTKATGHITLSDTSGTVTYGTPFTFTVTNNTSGGELSVSSADTAYATASISGNTVTVNCVQYRAATTVITVTSAETANYNAATATFTMTAARTAGTISLSATSATLTVSAPSTTITVTTNSDGVITATSSDTSVCTASVSGKNVTITGKKNGSATVTIAVAESTKYTAISQTVSISVTADIPVNMLSGRTLADVQSIFQNGQGANYFKAGDYFDITFPTAITMDANSIAANSTWRVVCLGIDHNSSKEGTNCGHFCIGKTTDGKEIHFVGHKMNSTDTNSGGWNSSAMKSWLNGTFYNALPSDLKNVITACTKYTDNTGGGSNTSGNVTSTSQKIWLLAEFEVFGVRSYANQYEQNSQAQYDYYKNGNSKVRYNHGSQSSTNSWWLRSPFYSSNSNNFCYVNYSSAGTSYAYNTFGVVPCFTIS